MIAKRPDPSMQFTSLKGWAGQPLHPLSSRTVIRRKTHCVRVHAAAISYTDLLQAISDGRRDRLTEQELLYVAFDSPLEQLCSAASSLRDSRHAAITFSPKVFLPITRLCRDSCGYCTFALPPTPGRRAYMTMDEVLEVAEAGKGQGVTEALLTLGDKPEQAYPEAALELASMGYSSTLDYVYEVCAQVLHCTGLLPHVNAGVMGEEELRSLRRVSASQGLMLESSSGKLMQPGGPHHGCPDKDPALRLATIEAAGRAHIPFTSGVLIGIGETREERIHALADLHRLHRRYGHIQELIIQNFRAKRGTAMEGHPEPPLTELVWTVAVARLMFGGAMNVQAPPNLTPEGDGASSSSAASGSGNAGGAVGGGGGGGGLEASWAALLGAGINDWGGLSPVTRDYVNPERPWPHLASLARATSSSSGLPLLPRLPIYPAYVTGAVGGGPWLDAAGGASSVEAAVLRLADGEGLARASDWAAGAAEVDAEDTANPEVARPSQQQQQPQQQQPQGRGDHSQQQQQHGSPLQAASLGNGSTLQSATPSPRQRRWSVAVGDDGLLEGLWGTPEQQRRHELARGPSARVARLLRLVLDKGYELREDEIAHLFTARGANFHAVCAAADALRQHVNGDEVTYVVNRNINYTNTCIYACSFCAFSKGKSSEALRGKPYLLSLEEVSRRAAEAWKRGATEVCMQGGIHPDFTGDTYLALLAAAKAGAPGLHVHAFSPLEVQHGAATLRLPVRQYLRRLKDAGLGSLPGTAAEILDDGVRALLCPDKLSSREWLQVVEAAHLEGLRSTSTIMWGHVDGPGHWAKHLVALRALQQKTGGITEFVPLPFVHMEAPIYLKGLARRGPTPREAVLMHAVARLALHPHISSIQASWVKLGPGLAAQLLASGCNDMGGSIMNESITRAAGASHGQELPPEKMESLIRAAGRQPVQRTTLYGQVPAAQRQRSFGAPPLLETR